MPAPSFISYTFFTIMLCFFARPSSSPGFIIFIYRARTGQTGVALVSSILDDPLLAARAAGYSQLSTIGGQQSGGAWALFAGREILNLAYSVVRMGPSWTENIICCFCAERRL